MSREIDAAWVEPDHVDEILQQWARERPDVDVSAMAIIGRISRLEKVIRPRLNAVFADHDLESWEFDVLATLLRTGPPNRLTPGELLASMMITSGAMTNRIDRLEKRGLVKRERSRDDGRLVLVTLTRKGRKKVDAALVDHAANELRIISALTPAQRAQLADLLRLLHHAVSAQPAGPDDSKA
ncbi:MarR family winged helix-turn-helix transcriptional regulator [Haliangium sp.]|uniref:MarR family winged helix-turn-helix transcriptional regulator n=1 Tax=Haliangium sp. TaxID=2663208 RepID=UPI003D0D3DCD